MSDMVLYINTMPSRAEPWRVSLSLQVPVSPSKEMIEETLQRLISPLLYKVKLPPRWGEGAFTPRYYVVVPGNVIGIRRDGAPTTWALHGGYWSPQISSWILRILESELSHLEEESPAQEGSV